MDRDKVFFYKDNSEDRDCVKYIDNKPERFECGHYFGGITIQGACFCGCQEFDKGEVDYDEITTILTKDEFNSLILFDKNIHEIGYGIKEGDERYKTGVALCDAIQPIFDKLNSEENKKLFDTIIEDEREYLKDEYNLSDEDIDLIYDEYYLDYMDRAVVGYVFDDIETLAKEEAWQLGYTTDETSRYFNYDTFGEDLLESEQYLELPDGRVVSLMY